MDDPLLDLGKLVSKETLSKLYDDAVAGPAKEVGKLGTDAIKVARLILAPLQIGHRSFLYPDRQLRESMTPDSELIE